MQVILDTNILVNNYRLDTPRFQGLFAYLKKTKSKLYIPEIVMNELFKKYKEALEEYSERTDKDNRVLFGEITLIDKENLNRKFISNFLRLVSNKKVHILKSKNYSTKKLFNRALNATQPFNCKGQGFRDTLIWLDIVNTVKKSKDYYCFISANSKDFGTVSLYKNLVDDLGKNADRLLYFNSIDDFLSIYGERISFIDKLLFEEYFEDKKDDLARMIDISYISKSSIEVEHNYEITDVENEFNIDSIEVDDFYIYSSTKDTYYVQVELRVRLELLLSIYDPASEEIWGYSEGTEGYTWCWIEVSLMIDKNTHDIELIKDTSLQVSYLI